MMHKVSPEKLWNDIELNRWTDANALAWKGFRLESPEEKRAKTEARMEGLLVNELPGIREVVSPKSQAVMQPVNVSSWYQSFQHVNTFATRKHGPYTRTPWMHPHQCYPYCFAKWNLHVDDFESTRKLHVSQNIWLLDLAGLWLVA